MKQHKVVWLEVEHRCLMCRYSRTFASYGEAEEFMMKLQRKHPVTIEYSEVEAGA